MITRADILSGLTTSSFGRELVVHERIGSTNDAAKALASGGAPEGTVVVAVTQTSGRGRQERSWSSEPGKNLTFSVVLRPRIPAAQLGVVPLYVAAAIAGEITELCPASAGCKWPNDVLVRGKKIAGILCESSITGASAASVVVGIGVNVNQKTFAGPLAATATSIALETGREHPLASTLCKILAALEALYHPSESGWTAAAVDAWTSRNVVLGSRVVGERGGTTISGIARGISPSGALRVETPNGTVELAAGDVHLT